MNKLNFYYHTLVAININYLMSLEILFLFLTRTTLKRLAFFLKRTSTLERLHCSG